ncbi:MAG: hypothetical protein E6G39_08865 [Actinobacteria bacterium]|jgi:hypothetical protein|nr:MAG: hypothetical protein E6G39_08865 [Actinomycetota bacterium]
MNHTHIKDRLEQALHRGRHKATEEELVEVAAVVIAVVGEVTAELVVLIGELTERVAALEKRPAK